MGAPQPDDWKRQTAIVMQRSDRVVLAELRRAERAINAQIRSIMSRPGFSGRVRAAQLNLAKRAIQTEIAATFRRLGDIVAAKRLESAVRTINLKEQLETFKLLTAGLPDGKDIAGAIADAEVEAARSGLDRMIARVQGASYVPLSQRVYATSSALNGPISTLVNTALASGFSAREFAKAVSAFINPNTPGGVRYAAMRLARTEINNAAHAVAVHQVQDSPWVDSMKWHLSGSHPRVDICNSLASGGPKSDGLYPKTEVPAKPHPHCFCFVVPELPSDKEFLDDLVGGKYNDYLDRYRNLQPGEVIRSGGGGFSSTRVGAPVRRTELPKAKTVAEPVRPSATQSRTTPRPPARKPLTSDEQVLRNFLEQGQTERGLDKLARHIIPDSAERKRAIANAAADLRASAPKWNGSIHPSMRGAVKRASEQAVDNSLAKVGPRINRLKEIKATERATDPAQVTKAMQSAFACCHHGIVYLDRGLLSRLDSLKNCQRSGWFAPVSAEVDQFTRVAAHEIGHALTIGFIDEGLLDDFMESLTKHLGIPFRGIGIPGPSPLQNDALYKLWLKQPLPGGRLIEDVIHEKFGKYALHSPAELIAEIWSNFTTDRNPLPAIRYLGEILQRLINEGKI